MQSSLNKKNKFKNSKMLMLLNKLKNSISNNINSFNTVKLKFNNRKSNIKFNHNNNSKILNNYNNKFLNKWFNTNK